MRVRAWLDTAAIVTIEGDEDETASPTSLAAAIVVAVDRATRLQESDADSTKFVGGARCRP